MAGAVQTVAVGLVSGVLSGAFGIGGGLVTTPAIRLLLGYPALVAVGTPLPVIVPGALSGAISYARRGLADLKAGLFMAAVGSAGSILGAWASFRVGGAAVMYVTSIVIVVAAVDMALQGRRPTATKAGDALIPSERKTRGRLVAIGAAAGLYSGFLGLGGGFIVVPALTRFCGMPVKRAIGTSLVTVAVLAIPGSVAHALLGNVDWPLAALLAIGVVPGALIGARSTERASDAAVRSAFAVLLAIVAVWLAASEMAGLLS